MEPIRLVSIIAAGEGLMVIVALVWARWASTPLQTGVWPAGLGWGIAAAAALGFVNLGLLRLQRDAWPGSALRHVCRAVVRPLFERVSLWQIVLISALAGLGEELLFRGVLQPLVGLAAASVLFGGVHIGGREFVGYGVWATCIGFFLGWLTNVTGGLAAAVVAHALYDALALSFIRFGSIDV